MTTGIYEPVDNANVARLQRIKYTSFVAIMPVELRYYREVVLISVFPEIYCGQRKTLVPGNTSSISYPFSDTGLPGYNAGVV